MPPAFTPLLLVPSVLTFVVAGVAWCVLLSIRSTGWSIFMRLPATVAHELSHWLVALVTGAAPSLPSIWPKRSGRDWILGSVLFSVHRGTAAFIALAPFLLLAPLAVELAHRAGPEPFAHAVLRGLAIAYLASGCMPSSTDFTIAIKDPVGLLLAVAVLAGMYHGYGLAALFAA